MLLRDLAAALPDARLVGNGDLSVGRIILDSRGARPGDLFVGLPGLRQDGARYVESAFAAGAVASAVERGDALLAGRSGLIVPSARRALGLLSAALHGWPSRELRVVGVTGTDGKTTTTNLIASILRAAGRRTGVVSTVRAEIGPDVLDTGFHVTTPEAPELQTYLRRMVEAGAQDAVLEVTSHALDQERVLGCEFDVAVVTNVTSDHLDYHRTYDRYLATKLRLFTSLATAYAKPGVPKVAVFNLDDRSSGAIQEIPVDRRLSYALEKPADVRARGVLLDRDGASFVAMVPGREFPIRLPLTGWYNVANALAAIATAIGLDVSPVAIQEGLARFRGIPGRFEKIDEGQPFEVVVDFAHTPNSLEQVLGLARERCRHRVAAVFGCAGLRDREKRSIMGEIAARYADRIYLTAEDPRTESVDAIIDEIAAGCRQRSRQEGTDFWKIPDRGQAIARAIADATEGDLVVITGKGHERSMCFGETEYPWSDQDSVREALTRARTGSSQSPPPTESGTRG